MLSTEELNGILIIRCHTDVVYEKAEDFRSSLNRLLGETPRRVVLDLEDARYLCSTALGTIASTYSRLRETGGDMILSGLTAEVSRLLSVTRLSKVIQIAADAKDAVQLLATKSA
ncbi:MAG: STAS domain-containing protein [Candidatus Wallbacteria bacterium]|nr:STAS domain-containing protein [Candidatus Wallbacteria bacterium]